MQAYKCDRCGEYYDNNDIYMDKHMICDSARNPIDLCPDCRADLEIFVGGEDNAVKDI